MYFLASQNHMKKLFTLICCALWSVSLPAQNIFEVRLNEILAAGTRQLNTNGNPYDFIELYNTGVGPVDLTGAFLTDGEGIALNIKKYTFPPGSTIAPGGFFVVPLDPDITNNNFGLTKNGDSVTFYHQEGIVVDIIQFGIQLTDQSIGRDVDGSGGWALLDAPSIGSNNVAAVLGDPSALRINEWMATGADYFELYNTGPLPVALSEVTLEDASSGPILVPNLSFIGTGMNAFTLFLADDEGPIGNHMPFKFSGSGDSITVRRNADRSVIDSVTFGPQVSGVSQGRLPDGSANITSFPRRATPGAPNFGLITNIVINELLAHTDPPLEDAIEFHNVTDVPVNMGGWFMSGKDADDDDDVDLRRFQLPENFIVPAHGYAVLYENQFRTNTTDPTKAFTFNSAHGGTVFISQPDETGILIAYLEAAYGPSANAVSFGRVVTSDGDADYTAMACHTFGVDAPRSVQQFRTGTGGTNNCGAAGGALGTQWGPVIISEIMYHPPDEFGTNNSVDEYVELRNVTAAKVPLYDPKFPMNHWRIKDGDGINFEFNAQDVMAPLSHLLLVNFDPVANPGQLAAFRTKWNVPATVPVRGPMARSLANGDDIIALFRPDPPQGPTHPDAGFVPYLLTDRVHYEDKQPWATNSNGTGTSLQRLNTPSYADEPTSWFDDGPTAGRPNAQPILFLTQPHSQSVLLSNTAAFNVTVSGSAPAFQWHYKKKALPGATNDTLTVTSANLKNAGLYWVAATNHAGRFVSSNANLQVILPVVIRTQPKSRTVFENTPKVVFKAKAVGTKPITYQWWFNGTEPIPGATNATLTVTNAQLSMSGSTYAATASNVLSGATSAAATLTVTPR